MKNSELFEIISAIDERYVDEAYGKTTIIKQSTITWRKIANAAACLAIVAVIGTGIYYANYKDAAVDPLTGNGGDITPENMFNPYSADTLQHCRFSQDGWEFSLILPGNWQQFGYSQVEGGVPENKPEIGWIYDGDRNKMGYNNLAISFSEGVYHETSNNGNGGSEGYTEPVGDVFMEIRPTTEKYSSAQEFFDLININRNENGVFTQGGAYYSEAYSPVFGENVYWVSTYPEDSAYHDLMIYVPSKGLHIYIPNMLAENMPGVIAQLFDINDVKNIYTQVLYGISGIIIFDYNVLNDDETCTTPLPNGWLSENMDNELIQEVYDKIRAKYTTDGIEWDVEIGSHSTEMCYICGVGGKEMMDATINITVDFPAEYDYQQAQAIYDNAQKIFNEMNEEYYSPSLDATFKIPVGYEVRGFENGFNVLLKEDFEKYGNEGLRASFIKYGSNNPANFEEYKVSIEAAFTKGEPLDENGNAKYGFEFRQYGSFYEAIIIYNFEDTVYYKGYDSATGITVDCPMADESTFQQILKLNGWGKYANTDGTYDYYSPSLDATYKIPVGYEPVESYESPYIGFSINMKGEKNWGGTYEVAPAFTKYYLSDNPPTSLEEFKAIVEEGFTSGQTLNGNGNPIYTKYDFETNQYGSFYEVIETNNITSDRWYKGYDTATGVFIDCPMADNEVFQKILELNGWGKYANTDGTYDYYSPSLDATFKLPVGYVTNEFDKGFLVDKEGGTSTSTIFSKGVKLDSGYTQFRSFEEFRAEVQKFTDGMKDQDRYSNFNAVQNDGIYEAYMSYGDNKKLYYVKYDSNTGIAIQCTDAWEDALYKLFNMDRFGSDIIGWDLGSFKNLEFQWRWSCSFGDSNLGSGFISEDVSCGFSLNDIDKSFNNADDFADWVVSNKDWAVTYTKKETIVREYNGITFYGFRGDANSLNFSVENYLFTFNDGKNQQYTIAFRNIEDADLILKTIKIK